MIPALMEEFKYKSVMAVPKLVKIVLNIGLGEAIREAKLLDVASEELAAITGQIPANLSDFHDILQLPGRLLQPQAKQLL